jgi:hypothetical protein
MLLWEDVRLGRKKRDLVMLSWKGVGLVRRKRGSCDAFMGGCRFGEKKKGIL